MIRIQVFSIIAMLLISCVGCSSKTTSTSRDLDEPDTPSSEVMTVEVVEPEPTGPWTTDLIPGRLAIGNSFPQVPITGDVLGAAWEGIQPGQRTLVYLHSYHEAPDDDEHSPIHAIESFAKTYSNEASEYRLLVLLTNFQVERQALELVAQAFGENNLVSVTHDAASFTQLGLIDPCASNGIPKVYVVGEDGAIDWIGEPEELSSIVAGIEEGEFDRQAAHATYEAKVAERRVNFDANFHFREAMKLKNFDRAVEVADTRLASEPNEGFWLAMKYQALLKAGRHSDINGVLEAMANDHQEDADWLAESAYKIAEKIAGNDLDLALTFAQRANELTGEKRMEMMHTLAVVHASREEFEQAIAWEEKTIASTDDGGAALGLDETLKEWQELQRKQTSAEDSAVTSESEDS